MDPAAPAAPGAWIAERCAAAVLPGLLLLAYAVAVAAASALRYRRHTPVAASVPECPLSTSPTAVDISQPNARVEPPSSRHKLPNATSCSAARSHTDRGIYERIETLRQLCNGLVWLVVAECLVHAMLVFALRQELVRAQNSDPQAVGLTAGLALAQMCVAAAWVLQLRHRYAPAKRQATRMQPPQQWPYAPCRSWTPGRECFWLLSLIASGLELHAYIACGNPRPEGPEAQSPLCSTMLRTLISCRIALNVALVACAAYGARLEQRQSQWQQQQEQLPPPLLHNADTMSTAYGATSCSALHETPSSTSTLSRQSMGATETTPLIAGSSASGERVADHLNLAMDDGNEDSATNALTSGAKKTKMYHQSDDLSHDIMGLRRRLGILLPYLWPSGDLMLQGRIVCCLLILIAGRIVNVLVPLQFKAVVDGLSPRDGSAPRFEWANVLLYAVLQSLQGSVGILSTLQGFVWIPVGQATTRRISVAMFDHLHQLSLRFHVGRKTGEILRVQDRGVTSVVSLLRSVIFNVIPTLADIALACYFFSVMFDLYFGTIVFTTMASYLAVTLLLTGWRTRYRRRSNYLDNEMEARAVDSLLNFETVKYYNAEGFESKEYTAAVGAFQVAEWASEASMNLMNLGQNLIVQTGLLAGALLSAKRVYEGRMTVGDFTMLLSYIAQLYGPLNWFGQYYRIIQKNFIDMEKLLELFDEPVEVQDSVAPVQLEVPRGEVTFDNVSFAYDKQPTLRNISFKVPAGSTVAIVGPSGSGKSTILRLLFRFYDVQSGRILIDGQDIRNVRQTDLRQAIGIVPQDTVLFNDSIRYNIAYGRAGNSTGVPMREVMAAADAAHVHDRVMGFAEQYETRVGERGQRLSGGEKQRVAIARTLLKDPRIVCLDEATSALDTNTERHIQASLREMTQNRTTLIIAHRLSTVIHADQILIVQNGAIVERGTHAELIADPSSVYSDMWMKQLTDAANASYNPFLDTATIPASMAMPMPGAMTPEHPNAECTSCITPPLLSTIPHPPTAQLVHESRAGEQPRTDIGGAGGVAHHPRDGLRLVLDEPLSRRWAYEGAVTVPLVSTITGANMFALKTASPTGTASSSLSIEAGRGGMHIGADAHGGGMAGNLADSATGQLSNVHESSCGASYEPFSAADLLRLQKKLQDK